jgi:hypothetical protein
VVNVAVMKGPGNRGFMAGWVVLAGLFLLVTLGPGLWIRWSPKAVVEDPLVLAVERDLADAVFTPTAVGQVAMDKLGTTNLFNGEYRMADGRSVSVFFADWRPEDGAAATLLMHTPDVCWVQAGWVPTAAEISTRVMMELDGKAIPFDCRFFQAPLGQTRELVVWVALVNGTLLDVAPPGDVVGSRTGFVISERLRRLRQMVDLVASRSSLHGRKQFVRYSVTVGSDLQTDLEYLKEFGRRWIRVTALEPEISATGKGV